MRCSLTLGGFCKLQSWGFSSFVWILKFPWVEIWMTKMSTSRTRIIIKSYEIQCCIMSKVIRLLQAKRMQPQFPFLKVGRYIYIYIFFTMDDGASQELRKLLLMCFWLCNIMSAIKMTDGRFKLWPQCIERLYAHLCFWKQCVPRPNLPQLSCHVLICWKWRQFQWILVH